MTHDHDHDHDGSEDEDNPADYEGEEPVELPPEVDADIQRALRGTQAAFEPVARQQAERISKMLGEVLRPQLPIIPRMRFATPLRIVPPVNHGLPVQLTAPLLNFKPQIRLLPPITTQLDQVFANLRTALVPPTYDFSWLAESFKKWRESLLPSNLIDFKLADLFRLTDIAEEQRIGVVWAPRAEVLQELLDADDAEGRTAVVERRRGEIVDDCAEVLAECEADWLADLPVLLKRAVAAFQAGHPEGAQALATSVLDTAINKHFDEKMQAIKALAREKGPDAQLWQWFDATVMAGIPKTWHTYDYGSGEAMYNRNGTVHCADLTVFSPVNAARAISLTTSLLLRMDEMDPDEDEDPAEDDS